MPDCWWLHLIYYMSSSDSSHQDSTRTNGTMRYFLGTYQVSPDVANMLTLQSYIDTLLGMSLVMGVVFELPVVCALMGRMGLLTDHFMAEYRRHAVVAILVVAAIITPTTDVFTLFIVALPIYLLYEVSIQIVRITKLNK